MSNQVYPTINDSQTLETSKPGDRIYPRIDDSQAFRLSEISRIRDSIEEALRQSQQVRRRYQRINRITSSINVTSGTVAVAAGGSSVATLSTGVGVCVSIPLAAVGLGAGLVSGVTACLQKTSTKRIEKQAQIQAVAESSMSRISTIVSQALRDETISDNEFQLVLQEKENFRQNISAVRNSHKMKKTSGNLDLTRVNPDLVRLLENLNK